jgi:hypothetical protein
MKQHMSYLDRKAAMEDHLREGLPPPEDELTHLINHILYLNSKVKQQAAENLSLKIQLQKVMEPDLELTPAPLERTYCGQDTEEYEGDIDPKIFYEIGAIMAEESGVNISANQDEFSFINTKRIPMENMEYPATDADADADDVEREAEQVVFEEINGQEFSEKKKLEDLAIFFKESHDEITLKLESLGIFQKPRLPERQIANSYGQQCVDWMLGPEAQEWFQDTINDIWIQKSLNFFDAEDVTPVNLQRTITSGGSLLG